MKKKSLLRLGILTLALFMGLAGCSSKEKDSGSGATKDGKTKISFAWWGGEARHEKYIKVIKQFEKDNPDIDVEYEYAAWDDYWKKLATKSAAGELPDVVQMDGAYLGQYGEKGLLGDLTPYIKDKSIRTTDIPASIVEGGKIGSKNYALSPAMTGMSVLYNKKLLEEAGVDLDFDKYSYDDYVAAINKVHAKTGKYGTVDVNDNYVLMQYYLRTQGEELYKYDKSGKPKIAFKKATMLKFFQSIYDMAKQKSIPTAEVIANSKSTDENPFALGDAGLYLIWCNQMTMYSEGAADGVDISIALPYGATTSKALYYRPSFYYSMSAKTTDAKKKAAAKLIDYFTNDKSAGKVMGTERGIPANTNVLDAVKPQMTDIELKTADYLTSIDPYAGDASPVPPVGFAEISQAAKDVYAELTYNTMKPEQAYKDLVEKMNASFEENYE